MKVPFEVNGGTVIVWPIELFNKNKFAISNTIANIPDLRINDFIKEFLIR